MNLDFVNAEMVLVQLCVMLETISSIHIFFISLLVIPQMSSSK